MAQPSLSQGSYDLINNIPDSQSRRQSIQPSGNANEALEHNEISRLSANLLSLFKEVILLLREQATIPKDARISLERSCSALILWSDGYGIAQGHLNDVLKKSSKLRHTLFKNLSHLGDVLTDRLIPIADISSEKLQQLCSSIESGIEDGSGIINEEFYQQSDDSSSGAGSTFSDDNIYEVAEDLKTDTCVLSSLDPLIKYPIFDLQKDKAIEDSIYSAWSPENIFVEKIENRFPLTEASLASRLGKANFERYLRCQADREALENEESEEDLPSTQQEAKSKFHDSGVGTSIAPTTNYAETIMIYSHKGQSVRIPPLPECAKKGLPFSCVVCGRTVDFTSNSTWKRHIYLDLQPYMCLDVSCSYGNTPFKDREKWISHLALEHEMEPKWDSIKCFLCKEQTGIGKFAVTRHFSEHLEEISLSALPMEVPNSNATSDNDSEPSNSDRITIEYPGKPSQSYLPCEANPEYCSKTFSTHKERHRHYRAAHKLWADYHGTPDLSYSCEACGKEFTRLDNKKRHLNEFPKCREKIKQMENDNPPKPAHLCTEPDCDQFISGFPSKQALQHHIDEEHTKPKADLYKIVGESLTETLGLEVDGTIKTEQKLAEGAQAMSFSTSQKGQSSGNLVLDNPPSHQGPPLPPGWIPKFNHSTQRWFYNNKETGVTQWKVPLVDPPSDDGISSDFSSPAHPDEDWTKISDLAERRRVQNRIAQRNYRKKLKGRLEDLERRAEIDRQSASGLPQQHGMQSKYPPATREPLPSAPQPYSRYASTPGPLPPQDLREPPSGQSYTPRVYDARGPSIAQSQMHSYPAPHLKDMQLRDTGDPRNHKDPKDQRDQRDLRDPRDIMNRGSLQPYEYDQPPNNRYAR